MFLATVAQTTTNAIPMILGIGSFTKAHIINTTGMMEGNTGFEKKADRTSPFKR